MNRVVAISCLGVMLILAITLVSMIERFYDTEKSSIDIVVARYNEDLDWLCSDEIRNIISGYGMIKTTIHIYNKGINNVNPKFMECYNNIVDLHVVQLPNVGRCDHTYLHHIITNYNSLADVTVFLPASCDMEEKSKKVSYIFNKVYQDVDTVFMNDGQGSNEFSDFSLTEWGSSHEANQINGDDALELANPRPFGDWFRHIFDEDVFNIPVLTYLGIFAISRTHILNRDISFYTSLIGHVDKHHNPEAGHYLERSWGTIFQVPPERMFSGSH